MLISYYHLGDLSSHQSVHVVYLRFEKILAQKVDLTHRWRVAKKFSVCWAVYDPSCTKTGANPAPARWSHFSGCDNYIQRCRAIRLGLHSLRWPVATQKNRFFDKCIFTDILRYASGYYLIMRLYLFAIGFNLFDILNLSIWRHIWKRSIKQINHDERQVHRYDVSSASFEW